MPQERGRTRCRTRRRKPGEWSAIQTRDKAIHSAPVNDQVLDTVIQPRGTVAAMTTATPTSPPLLATPSGPVSGSGVLRELRGDLSRRPIVDGTLAGGLREWLEDGVAETVGPMCDRSCPLVIDKRALAQDRPATGYRVELSIPLARGALIDVLFRQLVTTGRIDQPMDDGMAGLSVDERQADLVAFVNGLGGDERSRLAEDVSEQAQLLVRHWPTLAAGWLPRTQERITIPLSGGAVLLSGVIDLVVGAPSSGRASTGLVEVKSGRRTPEHQADARYYALLETLRSGAAPFRVATYYTATGAIEAEDVTEEMLIGSVQRVLTAFGQIATSLRLRLDGAA
jgi:hypothetical protein